MPDSNQEVINRARTDLAQRLGVSETEVVEKSVGQADFPDAALGSPVEDEMSAQVITLGWRILLGVRNETFEYRASGKQLRLVNFEGKNHRI